MIILTKRILGACLLSLAVLQCILVALTDHARKLGGHDLRPLLGTSLLCAVAALGLLTNAAWTKVLTSLLLASRGIWMAVRDTFIYKMADPLVSILFGILLCLPLIFTLRSRARTVAA